MLDEAKASAPLFLGQPPPGHRFDWFALMQHHGCPTRLLDVTESFYVAAYFALKDLHVKDDAAVWCFRRDTVVDVHREHLLEDENPLAARDMDPEMWEDYFNSLPAAMTTDEIGLLQDQPMPADIVVAWRPERSSTRMVAQKGLFLLPSNLRRSIISVIDEQSSSDQLGLLETDVVAASFNPFFSQASATPILKVVIPGSERLEGTLDLHSMNISEATLFPGLDGLCRSLTHHLLPKVPAAARNARNAAFAQEMRQYLMDQEP